MELEKYSGIISATLTPTVDFETKVGELVDFHFKHDVRGFFVLGTTGEGVKVNPVLRKKIAEFFTGYVGSKGLVVIHTGAADMDTVIDLTEHASKIGADAVAAVFPFYYKYDLESLVRFYEKVVNASSVPVLLYHNPETQGYDLPHQQIELLFEKVKGIAGIKDSSRDPVLLLRLASRFADRFFIASGPDELILYSLSIGVKAHVSGGASIFPDLVSSLRKAFLEGDLRKAAMIQDKLNVLESTIKSSGPYYAACKYVLKLRGVDIGGPYPPTRDLTASEEENLRKLVAEHLTAVNLGV